MAGGLTPAGRGLTRWLPFLLAAVYLAAHLPFLAPTLEDIDSLNFALGLRDFDPARHQPHPPGYPVYIALGRAALAAVHAVTPQMGRLAAEAWALSIWSALGGAAAIVFAWRVFSTIAAWDAREEKRARAIGTALWATVLMACSPLFWMTGLRPMSDMAGLAMALATQALLLDAARRSRAAPSPLTPGGWWTRRGDALVAGAFLAGLALGVRAQTFWLTLPLLAYALGVQPARQRLRATLRAAAAGAAGVVVWAVPLLIASGGLAAYLSALGAQAGEDIAHVDMLLANPTARQLAFTLSRTFILPWGAVPLAAIVMTAAAAGGLIMLLRERGALLVLAVSFVPYLVFHLLYQETITVRYALPLVPVVACVAARGIAAAGRWRDAIALPIAAAALIVAVPGGMAYGGDPHPAFRALEDIVRRADGSAPAFLTSHFSLARAIRTADPQNLPIRQAGRADAHSELGQYWASGGTAPIWFLADPRRTDLELIDASARRDVIRYRWAVERRPELSGTRPMNADWYRMPPPRWFLGDGWSLTPETGGVVAAAGTGPDRLPIVGYVRRGPQPMRLMIGGRHLGGAADGAAAFELALEGEVIDRWTLTFDQRNFLRFLDLPGGVPEGPDRYARLTVSSHADAAPASRHVPVAIRQFDLQPSSSVVWGFGPGWHEDEYVFETGLRWRWTSERSVIQVRGPAQAIRITVRGESPLRYFDAAPSVSITAAGRTIGRLEPPSDFTWSVIVPAADVAASGGDIAIETNRVFSPNDSGRSADTRRLGLRIYECVVRAARDDER